MLGFVNCCGSDDSLTSNILDVAPPESGIKLKTVEIKVPNVELNSNLTLEKIKYPDDKEF